MVPAGAAFSQGPYKVLDHWTIGGTGGWDYLVADGGAHRLYVTHGSRVEVLDTAAGKEVGAITGLKGTHGVALDNEGRMGYISDGGANAVVVFDRKTLATVATVPAGTNPDGIVFEPVTKTVWAFNGRSKDVTVIDAATNKVSGTLSLPGKPEFPVADLRGSVYDNVESTNEIVRFDARTRKQTAEWKLEGCDSPSGLAMDTVQRRLFAVCDGGRMAVVDADTGKVLGLPAIGAGPDAAVFSERLGLAFSSNGDGTLTVVDAAHGLAVVQTLATAKGARTMAYEAASDRVFLVTAKYGAQPVNVGEHARPPVLPDTFEVIVVGR